MKHKVKVKFKVRAETREGAEVFIDRLMRYGFQEISAYEQPTWKAIKSWKFGKKGG